MTAPFDYAAYGLQPSNRRIDPPIGPIDVASILPAAIALDPNGSALSDSDTRYTFRELGYAVNRIGALLREHGIGVGDRVAGAMLNRSEAVIAFFAAMRLGAVWVGMNRILPVGDKVFILEHSGAKLLIGDAATVAELEPRRREMPDLAGILSVDDAEWADALATQADVLEWPEIDRFAPAAIMYTSGTTGMPKGVVHSQHNLVTVAAVVTAHGLLKPDAKRGSVLPVTITNVMILGPVIAYFNARAFALGGSAKVAPMIEWLTREKVQQCAFVPTMIYDLLAADLELPAGMDAQCGGAPVPQSIRARFLKRYGQRLQPSYGLTEAPTVVALPQDRETPEGASGLALPHLRLSIRDKAGNELPPGEVGEVCFSAVTEGDWAHVYTPPLGYWRDPAKTAAVLRGGVVHSGDLGSLDADGWLTIADRSSELILRGGSNVYPAEIERVLHSANGVADCAVVGKPDERLGMRTVAFIQRTDPANDRSVLERELRALCGEQLSRYKVPDDWVILDALPRNAMGKVVKSTLRDQLLNSANNDVTLVFANDARFGADAGAAPRVFRQVGNDDQRWMYVARYDGCIAATAAEDDALILAANAITPRRMAGSGERSVAPFYFIVLSNPTHGDDDEFNRWYSEIHIDDVLDIPGFVAAQRFRIADSPARAACPWRYMAIYEVAPHASTTAMEELQARAGTDRMPLSPTLNPDGLFAALYAPLES